MEVLGSYDGVYTQTLTLALVGGGRKHSDAVQVARDVQVPSRPGFGGLVPAFGGLGLAKSRPGPETQLQSCPILA